MHVLDLFARSFLGRNAKYRYSDNFRFPTPIYTKFEQVLHRTIAMGEFEVELPLPTLTTFLYLLFSCIDLSAIVMHPTIALDVDDE